MKYLRIPAAVLLFFAFSSIAYAQSQVGEKAPGFITSTIEGKRVSLKDYLQEKGKKILILSFFATWCQPCKEDLKYLQMVQDQYAGRGLQLLSILTQDSPKEDSVQRFMQSLGVRMPVLLDENGIIGKRYAVTGLPCNFLIDQQGVLRAKYLGYSDAVKRDFESKMKTFLAGP